MVLGPTRFPGLPYEKKVFFDMDRTLFQALENYQAMVKAGVNTGMGTDSGPNGRFPGFNAHEEMQMEVILAGRTPMEAIKSATSDNARWLGDNSIGSIEQGKWADLVVLEKNPLDDIRNTETISRSISRAIPCRPSGRPAATVRCQRLHRQSADAAAHAVLSVTRNATYWRLARSRRAAFRAALLRGMSCPAPPR